MKRFLFYFLGALFLLYILYFAFVSLVPYSEGTRTGELIKFSHKGVIVKTWEAKLAKELVAHKSFSFRCYPKMTMLLKNFKRTRVITSN